MDKSLPPSPVLISKSTNNIGFKVAVDTAGEAAARATAEDEIIKKFQCDKTGCYCGTVALPKVRCKRKEWYCPVAGCSKHTMAGLRTHLVEPKDPRLTPAGLSKHIRTVHSEDHFDKEWLDAVGFEVCIRCLQVFVKDSPHLSKADSGCKEMMASKQTASFVDGSGPEHVENMRLLDSLSMDWICKQSKASPVQLPKDSLGPVFTHMMEEALKDINVRSSEQKMIRAFKLLALIPMWVMWRPGEAGEDSTFHSRKLDKTARVSISQGRKESDWTITIL